MSKHIFTVALALGFLGAASVNAQQPEPPPRSKDAASGELRPGETPTQEAMPPAESTQMPRPATSETEGTAADRTPPGRTPTTRDPNAARGQQTGDQMMGRDMVGASVISEKKQAPVGKVVDVVFSASNQPEFVVIESAGKNVAVPYSVANANMSANKITIDESRLQSAPKMKQGEWRSKSEGTWKKDATRYWEKDQG
jgi:hypothetical protein